MLMTYVLSQEMLGGKTYTPMRREDWVRIAVGIFLQGVENHTQENTRGIPERE